MADERNDKIDDAIFHEFMSPELSYRDTRIERIPADQRGIAFQDPFMNGRRIERLDDPRDHEYSHEPEGGAEQGARWRLTRSDGTVVDGMGGVSISLANDDIDFSRYRETLVETVIYSQFPTSPDSCLPKRVFDVIEAGGKPVEDMTLAQRFMLLRKVEPSLADTNHLARFDGVIVGYCPRTQAPIIFSQEQNRSVDWERVCVEGQLDGYEDLVDQVYGPSLGCFVRPLKVGTVVKIAQRDPETAFEREFLSAKGQPRAGAHVEISRYTSTNRDPIIQFSNGTREIAPWSLLEPPGDMLCDDAEPSAPVAKPHPRLGMMT